MQVLLNSNTNFIKYNPDSRQSMLNIKVKHIFFEISLPMRNLNILIINPLGVESLLSENLTEFLNSNSCRKDIGEGFTLTRKSVNHYICYIEFNNTSDNVYNISLDKKPLFNLNQKLMVKLEINIFEKDEETLRFELETDNQTINTQIMEMKTLSVVVDKNDVYYRTKDDKFSELKTFHENYLIPERGAFLIDFIELDGKKKVDIDKEYTFNLENQGFYFKMLNNNNFSIGLERIMILLEI